MICKFCGNEIDDNAEFCFICGQKVSDEATVFVASGENVYSQPESEVKVVEEKNENAAIEVEAPVEPFVAVAEPVTVATAPVAPIELAAEVKPEKIKGLGFKKVICFLFAIIGLIIYFSEKKKGNIDKANALLNALMTGLCIKMAVVIIFLTDKFMLNETLFKKLMI